MAKSVFTILALVFFTPVFSQRDKLSQTLIGKWTVLKIEEAWEGKKEIRQIEDTSYYVFGSNMTYTLTCKDLWGNAEIIGKWKPDSVRKFQLYDITHISDVKGPLPTSGLGYKVELKETNRQPILYMAHYDKELDLLYELYYRKNE